MLGKKKTFAFFTGVSMAALSAVGSAAAQEAGRVSDEIVVTAQKREQNIQDVPIAVTALSSDDLDKAGVVDIRALQNLSASFNLNSTQTESGGTTLRIRGVGTTGNNAGLESAVGVFIDGVYISRPSIALGELLDVQQVEILRGPQGTLFGRNTSAGALTISTRAPQLDTFSAFGNMTVGSFSQADFPALASVQAGVNIPVVEDKFALRFAGATRVRDGLVTSTQGGIEQNSRDRYYLRGQALFAPTDEITLRIIADYQQGNDDCCDAVIVRETALAGFGIFARAGLPANGGVADSGFNAIERRASNSGTQFKDPGEQYGVSAQLDWDLGFTDMTYIVSYRDSEARPNVQEDYTGIQTYSVAGDTAPAGQPDSFGQTEYTSHEVRFAGEIGRLQWLLGGYYGKEDIVTAATLTLGRDFEANLNANIYGALGGSGLTSNAAITTALTPTFGAMGAAAFAANPSRFLTSSMANPTGVNPAGAFASNTFTQEGETISVFTHNTFSFTDRFDVTVGARYVEESKDGAFVQNAASNPACAAILGNAGTFGALPVFPLAAAYLCFPFATPATFPGAGTVGSTTPAQFKRTFEDEELVYTANASYAFSDDIRGYASYTHGFKSGGFNLDPTAATGGADPRFNSETIDSIEIGVKADFFDGRLRANAAVFSSEIEDFQVLEFTGVQFVTFNVPNVQSDGAELETALQMTDKLDGTFSIAYTDARYPADCAPATAPIAVRSLCGSDLTNAPEWVSIVGLNYETQVGDNARFFISGSARYEDDRRTSTQAYVVPTSGPVRVTLTPDDIQEANTKVNLRLGYGAQDESWTVELFGTNIFDEQTRNVTFNTPLRGFGTAPSRGAFLEEPAIYGITIRANY